MVDKSSQNSGILTAVPSAVVKTVAMVSPSAPAAAGQTQIPAGTALRSEAEHGTTVAYDTTTRIGGASARVIVKVADHSQAAQVLPSAIKQTANAPSMTQGAKVLMEAKVANQGAGAITRLASKVLNSGPVRFLEENSEVLGPVAVGVGDAVHVAIAPNATEAGNRLAGDAAFDAGYFGTRALAAAPEVIGGEAVAGGITAGGVAVGTVPLVVGYAGKVAFSADINFDKAFHDYEDNLKRIRPHIDHSTLKTIADEMDAKQKPGEKLKRDATGNIDLNANMQRLDGYITSQRKEIDEYVRAHSQLDTFPETVAQKKAFIEATPNGVHVPSYLSGAKEVLTDAVEGNFSGSLERLKNGHYMPHLTFFQHADEVQEFFDKQVQKAKLDAAATELADIRTPHVTVPATNRNGSPLSQEQIEKTIQHAKNKGVETEGYAYTVVDGKFVPVRQGEPSVPDNVRQQYLANKNYNHNMGIQLTELAKHDGKSEVTIWDIRENPLALPPGTTARGQTPISAEVVAPPLKTPQKQPAAAEKPAATHTYT